MGAMFIGQQFLQNVLGYSTPSAGAAIIPAALAMVIVAPRSAKLVEAHGARFTLLIGYVFVLLGFVTMLLLWSEGTTYLVVALGYAFVGAGVGFAGTPASRSLTGSVPVTRAGMASGTADLQRDLGGAIMTSIFGALLTAGYAAAMAAAIAATPDAADVTASAQSQLTMSFAGADDIAAQYPQYAARSPPPPSSPSSPATSGRTSPAIVAVLLGAALVFLMFPRRDDERRCSPSTTPDDGSERTGRGARPNDPGGRPAPQRSVTDRAATLP